MEKVVVVRLLLLFLLRSRGRESKERAGERERGL